MTANSFGFGAPLTAILTAIDNVVPAIGRARDLPRWFTRQAGDAWRRAMERRQPAYFDSRLLRDIGFRRDEFPWAAHERLRDEIRRYHF
jgi:hypothetical protein